MTQRNQLIIFAVLVAVLAYLWLAGGEGVGFGDMGGRGKEAKAVFGPDDIPQLAGASPGKAPSEDFDRKDRDLFDYSESPEARAARLAEIKRREAEAAEKRRKAEEKRKADALAKAEREKERLRLKAIQDEKDRLERERLAALNANRPPVPEPEPVPIPPEFPYLYEGLIGPRDGAVAILRTKEEMKLAYVQAGQVLDEDFRIERVGLLNLTLSYTDPLFTGEVRRVPLRPKDRKKNGSEPAKDREPRSRRKSRR